MEHIQKWFITLMLEKMLSRSQVLIASMTAVRRADRKPIQKQLAWTIVISWIVTVPVTAVHGGGIWIFIDWLCYLII